MEIYRDEYLFTDDYKKINLNQACKLLRQSDWAKNRPLEVIEKTINNSLCFSVYHHDVQIGFARVVSDYSVFSLILDVIIDEKYRRQGLGRELIDFINKHPKLKETNKVLWTKHAKNLYLQCGFHEEDCYTFMFNRP